MRRPKCACGKPVKIGAVRKDGSRYYYDRCNECHVVKMAKRKGITRIEYIRNTQLNTATRAGYESVAQYQSKRHKYRKYRKDYCENKDGHLGFVCRVPKKWFSVDGKSVLQVDHIDGDPTNNDPSNLVTYCPTCHRIKTYMNNDHKTPGRKTLKYRRIR